MRHVPVGGVQRTPKKKGCPAPSAEAVCTPSSFPPPRSAAMYPNVCYPTVRPSVPIPSYSVWHKLALFLPSARGKGECVDLTPLTPPLSPLFQLISHDTNDLVMTFPSAVRSTLIMRRSSSSTLLPLLSLYSF